MAVKDLFRRTKAQASDTATAPLAFGAGYAIDIPAVAKTKDYVGAYRSWVFAAASCIAASLAAVPLRLYRDDGEEVTDHIFLDVMKRPNPFMTGLELRELTALYTDLAGEAFWIFERNRIGAPAEIWIVPPEWIKIVPSKTAFIDHYVLEHGGYIENLPVEDVLHFKNPNPNNPYRGMSTVAAAATAVDTDAYSQEYARRFFENSAIPAGVLEVEGHLTPEERTSIREQWTKGHKGTRRAHRIAILPSTTKYHAIAVSARDAALLEQRRYNRDEILAIFGVPASKIGIVEDVNRANAEAADYTYASEVIAPRLVRMEDRMNAFLVPQYDPRLAVRFDNPIPEDRDRRLREQDIYLQRSVMTINEVRSGIGFDEVDYGDVPLVPLNIVPLTEADYSPAAPEARQAAPAASEGVDAIVTMKDATAPRRKAIPRRQRAALIRYRRDNTRAISAKFLKRYRSLLKVQRDKVLAELDSQKSVSKAATAEIVEIIQGDKPYMKTELKKYFSESYAAGISVADVLGLEISFDLTNPRVMEAVDRMASRFSERVNDTTIRQVRDAVRVGLEEGRDINAIRDSINGVYDYAITGRAEMAARTETAQAYSQGEVAGYKESGVVTGLEWSYSDSGECPTHICEDLDGTIVEIDGNFDYPVSGDFVANYPPAHPNCECTLLPVIMEGIL